MPEKTNEKLPPPTISVILPVFNGSVPLERAVVSILGQTFPHWELLAVDDGSTDDSYDRLAQWAAAEPRIRVLRSAVNRGAAAARNLALHEARGDIVTYLDCFDEYDQDYLKQVQSWPTPAEVCLFCYDLIEDAQSGGRRLSWDPANVWERMTEANIACPLGIAHRRALLERTGLFEEKTPREEDWDLLKRFARAGAAFHYPSVKSGVYHVRPGDRLRTRRLADLAWQANGSHAPAPTQRPPQLVSYSDTAGMPQSAGARADAMVSHGTDLAKEGKREEAIALFRKALALRPDHARAHHNLGVALGAERKFAEALASFREALRCQPTYFEALYGLGNTLVELGRHEEAVATFRETMRHKPDSVEVLTNLGMALTRLGRAGEAAVFLEQAIRLKPDFLEGHNNLGLAHMEQGDFAAAEPCFKQALRLNPRYAEAHTNLGSAYKEWGRPADAVACYDLALALEPDAITPHWNRSLAWLQMGNFVQGWREYEWRWKRKETTLRAFSQPHWDGSPLKGRSILLHVEQGLGDMVQFLRYVPLIKERGGKVVVAAPPNLVALFSTCPGIDKVVPENQELPPCDFHAPLMSLPSLFETTLTTIPANV
ncbi:MAG TPA: tetratricopeptide repeat protein, partial [Gemmataceae bacterium]|nr:tetratricopeptide repeat protein [Gemmataceae bacterium]